MENQTEILVKEPLATRAKNFAVKYRTTLTVLATAAPLVAIHARIVRNHNEFLEEHGLLEEYYGPNPADMYTAE